jgi:PTH1 family peptidyl-tRNA hydrolase
VSWLKRKKTAALQPVALIVGLGNPGPEYRGTRHNVGFEAIDRLAAQHKIKLKTTKHKAIFGVGEINGTAVALAKPLTYMNLSGQAVKPLLGLFSLQPDQILVIADDLDLEVGVIKMKPGGSSGGHKGHKSLIQMLATEDYARIKLGIGKGGQTIDHVLGRFKPDERTDIDKAIKRAQEGAELFVTSGRDSAMNHVNSA